MSETVLGKVSFRAIDELHPHPRNRAIYGEESVRDLAGQIRRTGWILPLVVTSDGTIISGHRRWRAARELGITQIPVEVRSFATPLEELEALLLHNAYRDHKTVEQRVREAQAWEEIEHVRARQRQVAAAAQTNARLGRQSDTTLRENLPQASNGRVRDVIARRAGLGSGRTYEKARSVVTFITELQHKGENEQAQKLLRTLNQRSVDAAYRLAQREKSPISVEDMPVSSSDDPIRLLVGDFRSTLADLADGSVDLIFTDPPYSQEYLPIWSDLGQFAARVLRPHGILVTYSGQAHLPEVLQRLGEHLTYWWLGAVVHSGGTAVRRRFINGFKPLLFFVPPEFTGQRSVTRDTFLGSGPEKTVHDWQQGIAEATYYIDALSRPGELVVDPFMGSGTTGIAAKQLERRFIGSEVDPNSAMMARHRILGE